MKLKSSTFNKLNSLGFSHIIVPLVAVVVIGGIGSYLLKASHADSLTPSAANAPSHIACDPDWNYTATGCVPSASYCQSIGKVLNGTQCVAPLDFAAAAKMAAHYNSGSVKVGYAIHSNGSYVSTYNQTTPNGGASITKALLLVTYLNKIGNVMPSSTAQGHLKAMIESSSNSDANWVFSQLGSSVTAQETAVNNEAKTVGMPGFVLRYHSISSDYPYAIGESTVTAADFAHLFDNIALLMPINSRTYGLGLLLNVSEKVGLLQSGLPGAVYSKEGWSEMDKYIPGTSTPLSGYFYVVNQAAHFSYAGKGYGIGITVGGINLGSDAKDQAYGETVVKNIVYALLH